MDILRSWRELKVMLKMRFPELCDEDFVYEDGNRERMLTQLAGKLKKTRNELEMLLADLQQY